MKRIFFSFVFVALAGICLINACRSENVPGIREARSVIVNHFSNEEVYKGYVEVLDVKIIDQRLSEYLGGHYYDMKLEVKINVRKAYVISKLFTAVAFEVNEQWAENFETSMKNAQDEEQRNRIVERFENNTFSEGTHTLEASIGFLKVDDKWKLFGVSMWPK